MRSPLWIALVGMALLALGLGIGRFVFTPLLPLMQADAGLSLVGSGWLASINNLGYLLGALLCAAVACRQRTALRVGALAIALATACMGLTTSLPLWLLFRFVAGIAAALLVVHGIAWCTGLLRARNRAGLEPLLFSGVGIGVVIPGVMIAALHAPWLVSAHWWFVFGALGLLTALAVWRAVSQTPAAAGGKPASAQAARRDAAWPVVAIYGLMGFAYIIPAIFLPLIAGSQLHASALHAWFWPVYGGATAAAVLAQGLFPAPRSNYAGLAVCCLVELAGILLCLHWHRAGGFMLGAALLGAPCVSIVMFAMREANRLAASNPTRLIALLTTTFGIGQIIGPWLAARLASRLHGFAMPLELAALATAIAAVIATAVVCVRWRAAAPVAVGACHSTSQG